MQEAIVKYFLCGEYEKTAIDDYIGAIRFTFMLKFIELRPNAMDLARRIQAFRRYYIHMAHLFDFTLS